MLMNEVRFWQSNVRQNRTELYLHLTRQRIPRRLIFYHRSIIHRGRKIFSIAFAFDREEDVYHFVASAPYSYSRLQKYLTAWENRAQAFATRESIATTTVCMDLGVCINNLVSTT